MPKIIPEIQEQFLAAARQRIVYSEEHDLMMRQIARDCRTGVGTVYNYFPSKDALIAGVLSEDWQRIQEEMELNLFNSGSPMQDLKTVYEGLCLFIRKYHTIIESYSGIMRNTDLRYRYHSLLIQRITELVSSILHRYSLNVEPYTDYLLSEILLGMAIHKKEQFALVQPILCRILGVSKQA